MRIRGEIDSLKGRVEYLNKTTNNSQISIYVTEEVPISGDDDWNLGDSFDNSLRGGYSFLGFQECSEIYCKLLEMLQSKMVLLQIQLQTMELCAGL